MNGEELTSLDVFLQGLFPLASPELDKLVAKLRGVTGFSDLKDILQFTSDEELKGMLSGDGATLQRGQLLKLQQELQELRDRQGSDKDTYKGAEVGRLREQST